MSAQMNWDLSSYFPEFDGPEMRGFKEVLIRELAGLLAEAQALAPLGAPNAGLWEGVCTRAEDLGVRLGHWASYTGCLSSVDSGNEAYIEEEAELDRVRAEYTKLEVELRRALREADDQVFAAFVGGPVLAGCEHYLKTLRREAQWSMPPAEERLAADLGVDGIQAWGRLYDTLSGKLEFAMEFPDGSRQRLPISQRRALMADPDRQVRQAAFAGGNAAWQQVEDVAAAALNAIAGTRLTLNPRRGVPHFLDVALFQAAISRATLDAMLEAVCCRAELPRRALRLKARAMGLEGISWYDLEAPLPFPDTRAIPWEEAKSLVEQSFSRTYPELGAFTRQMYANRWIEWEPRPGKRPGGFCTSSPLSGESRIFMTYRDTLHDLRTLAHEAGHAWHQQLVRPLRDWARAYPMTLAETASTFGELVLAEGLAAEGRAGELELARLLDMEAGNACAYLLDIPTRFVFEKRFYEERGQGPLSVSRLKELMAGAQREVFGEVLLPGEEDPYFWASKLHFYITGTTFYNFPYTFGFLLSRGLFARFQAEGAAFLPRYQEFLRLTGSGTAEEVARQALGCNLEKSAFWEEAIQSLEEPLGRLEELLSRVLPQA
ncbi:MAG: M3 family oligoendopeptidase [Candidatus Handelsmanbacteria bacterium]|nr:M3 family oligoendopeptidase [Candidatus Handelsmanbacteria bacterium]